MLGRRDCLVAHHYAPGDSPEFCPATLMRLVLQESMELCCTIGISNVVNRFHATFHAPLDDRTRAALSDRSPPSLPEQPEPPPDA